MGESLRERGEHPARRGEAASKTRKANDYEGLPEERATP